MCSSIGRDDQRQHYRALILCLTSFGRVFRIGLIDCPRSTNSAANPEHAARVASAYACPQTAAHTTTSSCGLGRFVDSQVVRYRRLYERQSLDLLLVMPLDPKTRSNDQNQCHSVR